MTVAIKMLPVGRGDELAVARLRREAHAVATLFTPDGNHVDFLAIQGSTHELWRVGLLGGSPQRLAGDVWSGIGWSPDGRTLAFMRLEPDTQSSAVVVANPDGGGERIVSRRQMPLMFVTSGSGASPASRPSWSPDGAELLQAGYLFSSDGREPQPQLVFLNPKGGVLRTQPVGELLLRQAAWLAPDRLVLESTSSFFCLLGSTDLGGRNWTPLTREFAALADFTTTADRRTAVAVRLQRRTGIWIGDANGENLRPAVVESGSGPGWGMLDHSGALVYSALMNDGTFGLYRRAAEATQPALVTNRLLSPDGWTITRDGKIVVFTGRDKGFPLYRQNTDGSGLAKLIERNAGGPATTADDRSVLYSALGPGLFSVPLNGGAPRKISDRQVGNAPDVSPDGSRILFLTDPNTVVICRLPDCASPTDVKLAAPIHTNPDLVGVRWAPDGHGVAFVKADDPANIWEQPLGSGALRQLTRLEDRPIMDFRWTPDGKHLVLCRGRYLSDLTLITHLQ